MIRLIYWDLASNELFRNKKICVSEPFGFSLNLEIQIGETNPSSFFVLTLTNPENLKKYKVEIFDRVMFFYEDFYVEDLVNSLKEFIEGLNPSCEDEAFSILRKLFRWEFEDNLIYDFKSSVSRNPSLLR